MSTVKASVILPCYNRADLLPLSLAALRNQSVSPQDYEVLIVDDGSTDNTPAVARTRLWEQARYCRKQNGGLSSARNYGIAEACGPVLIFSDPDMIPCPDFVRRHVEHHRRGEADVVIGHKKEILTHLPWWLPPWPTAFLLRKLGMRRPDVYRKAVSLLFNGMMHSVLTENDIVSRFGLVEKRAVPFHLPHPPRDLSRISIPWIFLTGGNFSVSGEALHHAGRFDENFTGWGLEDVELGYRLHKHNARFLYEPGAINYHQTHRLSMRSIDLAAERNLRYFIEKHPCREVELHGEFLRGRISLEQYDSLVREHYRYRE